MKLIKAQRELEKSKIEKVTNLVTDALIESKASDMSGLMEQKKLTLWILGLATAAALFLVNRYSWSAVSGFSAFLFVSAIVLFFLNVIDTLYFYRLFTSLFIYDLSAQRRYRMQRMTVITALELDTSLCQVLVEDLQEDTLIIKLKGLKYHDKGEPHKGWIFTIGKILLGKGDEVASYLLILQLGVSLLLFLLN